MAEAHNVAQFVSERGRIAVSENHGEVVALTFEIEVATFAPSADSRKPARAGRGLRSKLNDQVGAMAFCFSIPNRSIDRTIAVRFVDMNLYHSHESETQVDFAPGENVVGQGKKMLNASGGIAIEEIGKTLAVQRKDIDRGIPGHRVQVGRIGALEGFVQIADAIAIRVPEVIEIVYRKLPRQVHRLHHSYLIQPRGRLTTPFFETQLKFCLIDSHCVGFNPGRVGIDRNGCAGGK